MTNARTRLALAATVAVGAWLLADRAGRVHFHAPAGTSPAFSIEDRARLFSAAERERIGEYHAALRNAHDIDYRVLATDDGGDLAWKAHRYFNDSRVGSLSLNGRGLLLVIDTALDRVRLEVSTSLEGVYPDAFVAYVENRQMVPFFRAGRVADGILATTELIVARAQDAEAGKAFAPAMSSTSMGGGAAAPAQISAGAPAMAAPTSSAGVEPPIPPNREVREAHTGGFTPVQVVEAYLSAMADRDGRPDLSLYSSDTVEMLRGWVMTAAQMDNVAKTYRQCAADGVFVRGDLAVVRYRVEQRRCAPYFLRRERGEWRLDLAAASSSIRFNHDNEWRLQAPFDEDYRFAFEDWSFDRKGFPRVR